MLSHDLFEVWPPPSAIWSPWAKPVLFASGGNIGDRMPKVKHDDGWLKRQHDTALIVNLSGADSVWFASLTLRQGWRPVPLFNGCPGANSVIPTSPIIAALLCVTPDMIDAQLPDDAPPAFLIDADRQRARQSPQPGTFDNRWMVFPQDFPSGNFLLRHGITRAVLVQADSARVRDDLAHVLLRWQQAGVQIEVACTSDQRAQPKPITVQRPRWFGQFWYRLLALGKLRPSSVGGFGSIIPTPSSGGYGGYG